MSIKNLIPDRVFLNPLSKCLPIGNEEDFDENGYLRKERDRGHAWIVSEKDPGRCNPEFVNIQRLWHKPSERPKPIRKDMLSVGCLIRYKYGDFGYAEYWSKPLDKWQDINASDEIKLEDIESWCYIKDLLPRNG